MRPSDKKTNKVQMDSKQKKQLENKIGDQIDFLSDHWVKGDDKPPFSFGGWRGEVVADLVELFSQLEQEARADERKKIEEWVKEYDKSYMGNPDSWAEKPGNNYTAGELVSYGWGVADLVDKLLDFLSKEAELGGKE